MHRGLKYIFGVGTAVATVATFDGARLNCSLNAEHAIEEKGYKSVDLGMPSVLFTKKSAPSEEFFFANTFTTTDKQGKEVSGIYYQNFLGTKKSLILK